MNTENIEITGRWTPIPQYFPGPYPKPHPAGRWTPIPQYFPGPYPKPHPAGRWVWIPNPAYYGGCDACRESGVCMCARPEQQAIFC